MHLSERRKLDVSITSEIDLEVSLRQRLLGTLQSRITWALLLQESLDQGLDNVSDVAFKDAALDALSAIEAPSDILFTREPIVPAAHALAALKGRPPPKEKPITRSQKSKFIYFCSLDPPQVFVLRCPICHRSAFTSLQGLYNHARISHRVEWGSHEECVKACAVPQQDFETDLDLEAGTDIGGGSGIMPGVKSLFQMAVEKHRHGVEAPIGEDGDLGEGEGLAGSVHLTRTLGLHEDSPALAPFLGKEAKRRCIRVWNEEQDVDICGFNGDEVHRRARWKMPYTPQSEPRSEMNELAIMKGSQVTTTHSLSTFNNKVFTASRFHIACRVMVTDSSLFIPEEQRSSSARDHTHKWMLSVESASYSIDLTTVLTSLTVSSISSSKSPLESIVQIPCLTATEPPFLVVGTTLEPFLAKVELMFNSSTSGQGQNGQKVILDHWVGLDMIGTNKLPTKGDEQVVDIELDKDTMMKPAKTNYIPVNSKLHWEGVTTGPSIRPGQNAGSDEGKANSLGDETGKDALDSYEAILLSLLPRYPMTLKDVSTNTATRNVIPPNLPYKLMANAQQLKTAVIGRRKAIEWARAKALHEAYSQLIQNSQRGQEGMVPLTVGDIYAWLEDEGHFIREKEDVATRENGNSQPEKVDDCEKGKSKASEQAPRGRWCRTCGLGLWVHGIDENNPVSLPEITDKTPAVDGKAAGLPRLKIKLMNGQVVGGRGVNGDSSSASVGTTQKEEFVCQIVPDTLKMCRLPVVDVERVLSARSHLQKQAQTEAIQARRSPSPSCPSLSQPPCAMRLQRRNRLLISAVDPPLLIRIHELVNSLKLPTFDATLSSGANFPLTLLGSSPSEVEECLSPHAYLALATTRFIRLLVTKAVEAERRDKELGVGYMFQTQNRDVGLLASAPGPSKKGRSSASSSSGNYKKEREKEKARIQSIRVLTPMHVLSGVASSYVRATAQAAAFLDPSVPRENLDEKGRSVNAAIAVFGCLSRLGIATMGVER